MPTISKQSNRVTPTTASTPTTKVVSGGDVWGLVNSIHMLLYGESGTGKSSLASTFPPPILWLVCSGGNKPGELRSINTPENHKRITPMVINSSDDLKMGLAKAASFATTVMDHGTGLADLKLREILGLDELPAQKTWGLATMQQYGMQALQLKESFRALLNLPGNVVLIAQQRTFGGKEEGGDPDIIKPTIGPAFTPSVAGWICPACDYVVQTFKRPRYTEVERKVGQQTVTTRERDKGVEYCLRTGPHDVIMTKFRIPRGTPLPECIVVPDSPVDAGYTLLMKVLRGEWEGE